MFRLPGSRCSIDPLTNVWSTCDWIASRSRSRSLSRRAASVAISVRASSAALPKPTIAGTFSVPERMPRSWPPPSICAVMRTRGLRRTYSAPTPFGPYILCADSDARSTFAALTSNGTLPDALNGVDVEDRALLLHDGPDLVDRVDRADLVVGEHDRHDRRLVGHRRPHRLRADAAVLADRQVRHLEAVLLEALAGVQHRLVLGLRGDDVVAAILQELGRALDGEVVGFGRARRPDDFLARSADQRADLIARRLDRLLGRPAEAVRSAGGVAEHLREVRQHRLEHARIDRRGRVVVHVDGELQYFTSLISRSLRPAAVRVRRVREFRRCRIPPACGSARTTGSCPCTPASR